MCMYKARIRFAGKIILSLWTIYLRLNEHITNVVVPFLSTMHADADREAHKNLVEEKEGDENRISEIKFK